MEILRLRLQKTECHFNWRLGELQKPADVIMVEKLEKKIEEMKIAGEFNIDESWPLLLTYSYEMFLSGKQESFKIVDDVIQDLITNADDTVSRKYSAANLHIAYSLRCNMSLKIGSDRAMTIKLGDKIKFLEDMSKVEKSGILARKATMLAHYGPDGIFRAIPLVREAIQLNPDEADWKYLLVVCLNKKRHFEALDISWSVIEEPVNILEELLNDVDLTPDKVVKYKYMLAVAYRDYVRFKNLTFPDVKECSLQIRRLCEEIHDKSENAMVVSFCAQQLYYAKKSRGIEIIQRALEKFPDNINVNTMAADMYRKEKMHHLSAKYAQVAMDAGGYGAVWHVLQSKVFLHEEFDDDKFFDGVLKNFQGNFKKRTLLQASLYYFYSARDTVKGAKRLGELLDEDPTYENMKYPFCFWSGKKVHILEDAYGRIVDELRQRRSASAQSTLSAVKDKIEHCKELWAASGFDSKETKGKPQREKTTREDRRPQKTANFGDRQRR